MANKITIFRVLLIPFFVIQVLYYLENGREGHRWLAVASFAAAALSDAVDGYIARRYNQKSELGAILDPLADKLLLVSGVVLLSWNHASDLQRFPIWLTVTIISRDLLLLIGLAVIHYACGKALVRPRLSGKAATVLQMTAILWILLKWDAGWLRYWTAGAALLTGVSGLLYVWDGVRQLSASPSSSAIQNQ